MAYILLSENCRGRHINFIQKNGEFYEDGIGKEYSGTLALQTFEDRPYMRITFADGKNVWGGVGKKLFGIGFGMAKGNYLKAAIAADKDYLCHFDFSKEELRSGRKKIRYIIQFYGLSILAAFMCYDLSTGTGCSYMFSDDEIAEKWAKTIGLTTVEYLDDDGKVTSVKPLT